MPSNTSLTRRWFLWLTGGLGVKLGLLLRRSTRSYAVPPDARTILRRMGEVYAGCRTYRDRGCVSTTFIPDEGTRVNERPFTTAFVRPDDAGYDDVEPDVWFYNEEAARRAGFHRHGE